MSEENNISPSIGSGEVSLIQNEIEVYTRQIEHEKINLRLARERYMKQFQYLQKLRGKSSAKERRPYMSPKQRVPLIERTPKIVRKINEDYFKAELIKTNEFLDVIVNQSNECQLDCNDIRKRIEELRKEKLKLIKLNENLNSKLERLSIDLENIAYLNMVNETEEKGIIHSKMNEFNNILRKSKNEERSFEEERDDHEANYQGIIEVKIKKEREHHKEFVKKRPDYRDKSLGKNEEDEMIRDRTPILDLLIEKFSFFIVEKRKILERYQKHMIILKESLDFLVDLLGVNEYNQIPFVLDKIEQQHAQIEIYSSNLHDELNKLEKYKETIQKKIETIKDKNKESVSSTDKFRNIKQKSISELRHQIKILNENMESKRDFFNRIKNPINEFLENMDKLCISDYVPSKVKINRDIHFNEHNIERVISNVEDYNKFIYDLDKVSSETHKKSTIISKDDDKNKIDINAYKISNLKKEIIPSSFFKTDLKTTGHSQDFDDIMKNKAEEILNKINQMSELIEKKKKKIT